MEGRREKSRSSGDEREWGRWREGVGVKERNAESAQSGIAAGGCTVKFMVLREGGGEGGSIPSHIVQEADDRG